MWKYNYTVGWEYLSNKCNLTLGPLMYGVHWTYNGNLYIFGGAEGPAGTVAQSSLFKYNFVSGDWENITSIILQPQTIAGTLNSVGWTDGNGTIWIMGGTDRTGSMTFESFCSSLTLLPDTNTKIYRMKFLSDSAIDVTLAGTGAGGGYLYANQNNPWLDATNHLLTQDSTSKFFVSFHKVANSIHQRRGWT